MTGNKYRNVVCGMVWVVITYRGSKGTNQFAGQRSWYWDRRERKNGKKRRKEKQE
jgi:hypothetical protein